MRGLIVKGIGGFYYVETEKGVIETKGRGIFKKDKTLLKVGDDVEISILPDGTGVINKIHKRRNAFDRPPIANIDMFAVVFAAHDPDPNFDLIDRFLLMAEKNDMEAILVMNKCDLASKEEIDRVAARYEGSGYGLHTVSALEHTGIEELMEVFSGKRTALAGPSGAGKSSLTNVLVPHAKMETGTVNDKTGRGRHTTRHVEIFRLAEGGGLLFDTPGFTAFDLTGVSSYELGELYPEIAALHENCRFRDCRHMNEPGCAVSEAAACGNGITDARYRSYLKNLEEILEREKNQWR
ncbi:MAG: ribosome small subunit-dependent GTPase A [Eubacterium sp.]|nr:ribosome small subunit-dependent GTPase A [Eubacterium sp.]